jgi:hypothetical protein
MIVVVTGGREFTDVGFVWASLDQFVETRGAITALICGMARGVDMAAWGWADYHNVPIREFKAQWTLFEESAGPRRNQEMIDENPDLDVGIVFPGGVGTADMTKRLRKAGIERVFYQPDQTLEERLSSWG